MKSREYLRILTRATGRITLQFFSWFFNRLPYGMVRVLTRVLISVAFCFVRKLRVVAEKNLYFAFGKEKNAREIQTITRQCFKNVGHGMIEMLYFMEHPVLIKSRVSFEGKKHLEAAMANGKGVIAVTAHFGNFPLMMLRCIKEGYNTHVIVRSMRDPKFEEFVTRKRKAVGLNTIHSLPRRKCVKSSLDALKNKDLLFIPLDQNFGSKGGVFVDFFGRKAATATGPVVFARRSGAVILPIFIARKKDGTHKIMIEPPLKLQEGKNDADSNLINTARITQIIEKYIRKYPEEWGWMHRRWKSRPQTKKD